MCSKFSKWLHKIHICSVHIHFVWWQNVWQNVVVFGAFHSSGHGAGERTNEWTNTFWSGNVCHESRRPLFVAFCSFALCTRPRFHLNNHINNNNNANEWLLLFFMLFLFSFSHSFSLEMSYFFLERFFVWSLRALPHSPMLFSHISLTMRNRFHFCAIRYIYKFCWFNLIMECAFSTDSRCRKFMCTEMHTSNLIASAFIPSTRCDATDCRIFPLLTAIFNLRSQLQCEREKCEILLLHLLQLALLLRMMRSFIPCDQRK